MSVQRFLRTPATLIIPGVDTGETDDMGDPIPVRDVEVEVRCRIVSARAVESRDGGNLVAVETLTAFLPADTAPIPSTARLRARGVVYSFDGPAQVVDSPRSGRVAYVRAPLRVAT